jgi:hypothetical protein
MSCERNGLDDTMQGEIAGDVKRAILGGKILVETKVAVGNFAALNRSSPLSSSVSFEVVVVID